MHNCAESSLMTQWLNSEWGFWKVQFKVFDIRGGGGGGVLKLSRLISNDG